MRADVRRITSVGALAAAATVVMMFVKFPIVPGAPFLKYDPSDAVTLLAAFWLGPGTGLLTVALKDLLLWLIHDGNPLGPLADAIAAGTFVGISAVVFRRLAGPWPAPQGAAPSPAALGVAVLAGTLARVAVMAAANFPILYLEFGTPPDRVAALLLPAIVPFNALKSLINGALAAVLVAALTRRRAALEPARNR